MVDVSVYPTENFIGKFSSEHRYMSLPATPVQELLELTERFDQAPPASRDAWLAARRKTEVTHLIDVVANLTTDPENPAANKKALREALIAEIEYRNTERVVDTMKHLDRAASRLTWASFFVGVVGLLLAAIQTWPQIRTNLGL